VPLATANVYPCGRIIFIGTAERRAVVGWGNDFTVRRAELESSTIRAVAASQRHVLALSRFGEVMAYGYNGFIRPTFRLRPRTLSLAAGRGTVWRCARMARSLSGTEFIF
jgi:hypothetical protein